jgi:DNA adenine methylase
LAKGSGLIKYGENGKGLHSRWYPQTIARRIGHIRTLRDKITFLQGDGLEVIDANINNGSVFFLDPPYTAGGKKSGSRLYNHHELDQSFLFLLCNNISHFLMTYDVSSEIEQLAGRYSFEIKQIPMKNTHNTAMNEYIISKDLGWLLL